MRTLSAVLAGLAVLVLGCGASPTAPPPPPLPAAAPGLVRVLQLNLCNSGIASCYTGRAVDAAAAAIRATRPETVTVNEVCSGDDRALEGALAAVTPGAVVTSAFRAARDGRSGGPYRCRDGREYGIAVLVAGAAAEAPVSGVHPAQDPNDPEQRVWLCLDGPRSSACTSHLAYTDPAVTDAQCRYLFDVVLAGRARPTIVGGDLNLRADDPLLRRCLPPGSVHAGDGGPQHVVAPPGDVVTATRPVDLGATTDRPGLLVEVAGAPG